MPSRKIVAVLVLAAALIAGCAQPTATTVPQPTEPAATEVRLQPTPTEEDVAALTTAALQLVAEGLVAPVDLEPDPTAGNRLFVVDQVGVIYVVEEGGQVSEQPFLDIRDRIVEISPDYDERGLLGLAFHPSYADNGRFFVYYCAPPRPEAPAGWTNTNLVSEFRVSDDPVVALADSERVLLEVDQPQANHDGGDIAFGPDGYLYIPLGDGGGANDVGEGHTPELGNGQDTSNLLGSILRIDVDEGEPYAIPDDNPFVANTEVRDEIYAYGLRNPWRATFDSGGNQRYFVGDAGQDRWEEVNLVESGGNYGWNIMEGTHCFDPENPEAEVEDCPDSGPLGAPLLMPIIEYPNANQEGGLGYVVVGGYVYRGTAFPTWDGAYLFGDWRSSRDAGGGVIFLATEPEGDGPWPMEKLTFPARQAGELGMNLLSFGRDTDGELYVLTSEEFGPSGDTGKVWKILPPGMTMEEGAAKVPERRPMVAVNDQPLGDDGTVTVSRVLSEGPGWLVIHAESDGAPGPVVGYQAVDDGENTDLIIEVDEAAATGTMYAMLHVDAGQVGEYEFPGPDEPALDADGGVVVQPFAVEMMEPMAGAEASVGMSSSMFEPAEITVAPGTTIVWTNGSSLPHTVTADDGAFASGTMEPGDTFEHTFEEPGTYPYYCEFHGGPGGTGMSGTVTVE